MRTRRGHVDDHVAANNVVVRCQRCGEAQGVANFMDRDGQQIEMSIKIAGGEFIMPSDPDQAASCSVIRTGSGFSLNRSTT